MSSGDKIMPVTVKTFATSGEAAAALSSERDARYLGGGTLVMRALNEGDRLGFDGGAGDRPRPDATRRRAAPASRSAPASPSRAFSPSASSPFCIRSPPRSAARRCATWARSAAICSRRRRSAISPSRCSRSMPPLRCRAAMARATCRSRNSSPGATGMPGGARALGLLPAPVQRRGVSLSQDRAHQAEGRLRGDARRPCCRRAAAASSARASRSARWRRLPFAPRRAERALEGRALDAASIAAAVAAATEGTSPTDDSLASAWYRREVVGVHLRRLLAGEP